MSLEPTSTTSSKNPLESSKSCSDRCSRDPVKQSNNEGDGTFQIFLGGSCNPTTWRQSVAIPYLETNGITYYNPQVEDWTPELVKIERHAKQSAQVLLFVLDEQTRSTVSLVESAFMAGEGTTEQTTSNIVETRSELTKITSRKPPSSKQEESVSSTVLQASSTSSSSKTVSSTVKHASGTIKINGEIISIAEFHELRQARIILQNLVDKHNTAMFSDIPQALDYVTKCLADDKSIKDRDICTESPQVDKDQELKSSTGDMHAKPTETNSDGYRNMLRDVYLMLDDYDDKNIESSLILMLQQRGLSYRYRPLREIIEQGQSQTGQPSLTKDQPLPITNDQQEVERFPRPLNAQIEQSTTLSLGREMNTIQSSRVLLLVITNKCRGLSIMVLASYFMALFRNNVVLCIQYLEEPCSINGEILSKNAIADYNRGRVYLCDYAVKSQVPVFKTIKEAVDCCSQRCGDIKD